ncbi:MAG: metallophosphoesterase family protein [Proteobacteria bacterium]|nr:metallophosphoesterase family protein [Pseudomonadota bacterium]
MFWKKKKINIPPQPVHKTPIDTRIYAIGDIHGNADLLNQLHKKINDDAKQYYVQNKIIIYLGDYIDRGLQSKEVIDTLINNPLEGFKKIYLKGNHEEALLTFLEEPEFGDSWFLQGGQATVRSYGAKLHDKDNQRLGMTEVHKNFNNSLPSKHLEFYRNLKISHIESDYIFVHAGLKPGVDIKKQKDWDMLTIREEFVFSKKEFDKTVVFGHTIFTEPFQKNKRIGIDTGAYAYGKLTCVVLQDSSIKFLTATTNEKK